MAASNRWYFAWVATPEHSLPGREKGVILKATKWSAGEVIPISFLDGDPLVQARVREAALGWTRKAGGPANVIFDFRSDTVETPIRISFQHPGSWSMIGTTCRSVAHLPDRPTMNFGWLDAQTPLNELNGVVLHEFGHALGLAHEHQSPAGGIDWDEDAVSAHLSGPPNYWAQDVIRRNVLDHYHPAETEFTAVDRDSIMLYPIPTHWTRNGFSSKANLSLSANDRLFVAEQYP